MREKVIFLLIFFTTTIFSNAQDTTTNKAFGLGVSYTGDNLVNTRGGIKEGYNYLGMTTVNLNFDTEKAGLWRGGFFYINGANTHGGSPSADLMGDIQVASNIEAGNHTYIQELWYKHSLNKLEFTIGLQDLNVEFANNSNGGLYLNSSFGILPTISQNIAAPIFPLTSLGLTVKWNLTEQTSLLAAIYDGCPTGFENNPHNLNWQFLAGDGVLAITEIQRNLEINKLPGTYKLGIFNHNHLLYKTFGTSIPDSLNYNILGIYFNADQSVWKRNSKDISLFSQVGMSPSKSITNSLYFGLGANYTGLFNKKGNDILGLALAYEKFANISSSETVIELSYQYNFLSRFFIQPDFQYIINPSGFDQKLPNSFVTTLRFGLNF